MEHFLCSTLQQQDLGMVILACLSVCLFISPTARYLNNCWSDRWMNVVRMLRQLQGLCLTDQLCSALQTSPWQVLAWTNNKHYPDIPDSRDFFSSVSQFPKKFMGYWISFCGQKGPFASFTVGFSSASLSKLLKTLQSVYFAQYNILYSLHWVIANACCGHKGFERHGCLPGREGLKKIHLVALWEM